MSLARFYATRSFLRASYFTFSKTQYRTSVSDLRCVTALERLLGLIGQINSKPFFAGNSLSAELVVWRESSWMRTFCYLPLWCLFLQSSFGKQKQNVRRDGMQLELKKWRVGTCCRKKSCTVSRQFPGTAPTYL